MRDLELHFGMGTGPFGSGFLGSARLGQASYAQVSIGKNWWAHHIANTRAYLEAALAVNVPASLSALMELWAAVADWQAITRSKLDGLLMAEHTALAKLLIDCAADAFPGVGGCVDTAAAALGRNVEAHGALFSKDAATFTALFGRHVEVTGKYVGALAAGSRSDFEAYYAEALENGEELGAFTDRTFLLVRV
jgi:hypothetical protein